MTITTPGGRRIGVVHADTHHDWNEQVARLSSVAHDHHDAAVRRSLWRCDTIEIMKRQAAAGEFAARASEHIVRGIDHVFHGHTIVGKAFSHANRSWLDTGAYRGNPFSIVDADQWLSDLRNLALCGERGGNL